MNYLIESFKKIEMKILISLILTLNFCGYSQTLKNIVDLEYKYQKCLDSGNGMTKCSENFYKTSDSLLNVSYKNLILKLNIEQQNKLKTEQRKWLKTRNIQFKEIIGETINEIGTKNGTDLQMIIFDKKSEFVIGRVKEFINRRNKIK